jgi:hypothetical protein
MPADWENFFLDVGESQAIVCFRNDTNLFGGALKVLDEVQVLLQTNPSIFSNCVEVHRVIAGGGTARLVCVIFCF